MKVSKKALLNCLLFSFFFLFSLLSPKISHASTKVFALSLADLTINPIASEYILRAIERAESENAECLLIEMDTPGGLLTSTRSIVKGIMASRVPVIVYVSPKGSRAGSAGVFIAYAAHVAAMAPSTNIGAAHPVQMGGQRRTVWDALRDFLDSFSGKKEESPETRERAPESPMEGKILHDAVAFIRGLADERGRNADWAEKSVTESASVTAREALELGVVDMIAEDTSDLLMKLDGRTVRIGDSDRTLHTKDAEIIPIRLTGRQGVLNILANPNVAYFLLLLGFYGLLFEVTHPGIGVPGVLGTIFIILAFFGMQMLPTNYAGLALLVVGILLLGAEAFVPGFGLPTLGGVLCLVLGSLMLFNSPHEFMRVSSHLILALTASTVFIVLFLIRAVVSAHRRKVQSGREAMIGEKGIAQTTFAPGQSGQVLLYGEIWTAVSKQSIQERDRVRVVRLDGMTAEVEKI